MTLPAFAAERRHLQHVARIYRSISPARRAFSDRPAVADVDRWDRRTDGRPTVCIDPARSPDSPHGTLCAPVWLIDLQKTFSQALYPMTLDFFVYTAQRYVSAVSMPIWPCVCLCLSNRCSTKTAKHGITQTTPDDSHINVPNLKSLGSPVTKLLMPVQNAENGVVWGG